MGYEKGDVEAAGEKAQVQQDVAWGFEGGFDCFSEALSVCGLGVLGVGGVVAAGKPP
ncbi:hypothetical protein TUM15746_17280 [Neisseria gonorrhoeae]|nr:hypothetical protein M716_00955 [Neisseria gonorrhoeae SK32402]KLS36388.1 hypothetical protein M724_07195 [Neisseria gonorrhoeae ATL_2011_01_05]KLS58562.1 hypothetical protein M743_03585 [Neisseria gonorrhoeae NYC_2011_05_13]KLS60781.1 hypothetical protein M742_09145 [Neisseria gonorrhoeae NYC_2011_05_07]KLS77886.1 hypothetical protein M771_01525 [Neisseria gonorrhoeae MU_NG1]KLS82432.1 hypothetical protein M786_10290 [Neisseria gonorrhoeae MU_NG21]KLS90485.1 hypothetical protein M775_1195